MTPGENQEMSVIQIDSNWNKPSKNQISSYHFNEALSPSTIEQTNEQFPAYQVVRNWHGARSISITSHLMFQLTLMVLLVMFWLVMVNCYELVLDNRWL
jgi:ascorbate-specific PTS system EIIC-type component UlaA